jgi:hypothetical protein
MSAKEGQKHDIDVTAQSKTFMCEGNRHHSHAVLARVLR